jgi:hypothetical protein
MARQGFRLEHHVGNILMVGDSLSLGYLTGGGLASPVEDAKIEQKSTS